MSDTAKLIAGGAGDSTNGAAPALASQSGDTKHYESRPLPARRIVHDEEEDREARRLDRLASESRTSVSYSHPTTRPPSASVSSPRAAVGAVVGRAASASVSSNTNNGAAAASAAAGAGVSPHTLSAIAATTAAADALDSSVHGGDVVLDLSDGGPGTVVGGVGAGAVHDPVTAAVATAAQQQQQQQPPVQFRSSFDVEDPSAAPRRGVPKRTLAVALFLLVTGIVCFCIGIARMVNDEDGALALMIIGGIAMLPGAYQTFVIYRAWRGDPRYSFNMVPSFDD